MTNKGKTYENKLANELDSTTNDSVNVYPAGYSGNHSSPSGDVVVTHKFRGTPRVAVIEAKRWACEQGELRYINRDDILQLVKCGNDYTDTYIAVSFDHRELIFFEVYPTDEEPRYGFIPPKNAEVHTIDSGNLRVRKPSLDLCRSAKAGYDDSTVIFGELTQLELDSFPQGSSLTVS